MNILSILLIALLFFAPIQANGFFNSIGSFAKGVFTGVKSTAKSTINAITRPIVAIEAVAQAITHPVDTVKEIIHNVGHCDSDNKAECIGQIIGSARITAGMLASGSIYGIAPV